MAYQDPILGKDNRIWKLSATLTHSPWQTQLFCTILLVLVQSLFLLLTGGPGLGLWGASTSSAMRPDAWTYLSIRGLGAPFTVVLLVLQARSLLSIFGATPRTLASEAWGIPSQLCWFFWYAKLCSPCLPKSHCSRDFYTVNLPGFTACCSSAMDVRVHKQCLAQHKPDA